MAEPTCSRRRRKHGKMIDCARNHVVWGPLLAQLSGLPTYAYGVPTRVCVCVCVSGNEWVVVPGGGRGMQSCDDTIPQSHADYVLCVPDRTLDLRTKDKTFFLTVSLSLSL